MPTSHSNRRLHRLIDLQRRLDALTHELDTIPDRKAPLTPQAAQRGWRVIDDVRRALRLAPVAASQRGTMPFDLAWQRMLLFAQFSSPEALSGKAPARSKQKTYARRSAPRLQ
jgi:hypothetical protein